MTSARTHTHTHTRKQVPVRKRAASGYETSSSRVRTGSAATRHGKAINHNIGRASQRTHCRATSLIDRLTRPDLSPPAAASHSPVAVHEASRRPAEPQCRPFSAVMRPPRHQYLIGYRGRNRVAHSWMLRPLPTADRPTSDT